MDTASLQFVAFGLIVALFVNVSHSRAWRAAVLLLASLAFIVAIAKDPASLLPLAGFLAVGYACMVLLQNVQSRLIGWTLAVMVLVYIWLKKYTFLPEASFIHRPYFVLGLSYIFFRVLHLLIEVPGQGKAKRIGPISYLVYTLNFTTFISGPIQNYDEFARDQFAAKPIPLGACVIGLQLERILRGLFKVNVLAMLLNMYRVDALAQVSGPWPDSIKMWAALRLSLLYPLFLYANFSGYIDVVIALARLMRLRLPENFDRPFATASVIDFWNSWHITLSNWLKNYVYNPLLLFLMRRVSSPRMDPLLGVICFFVTFFLVGLWHGRTSEFLMFGLVTGGGISVNKLWQIGLAKMLGRKRCKALAATATYVSIARGLNFIWFAFTLFWFWGSWSQIDTVFSSLTATQWLMVVLIAWFDAAVLLAIWEWLRTAALSLRTDTGPVLTHRYARVVYASIFALFVVVFTVLLNQPAPAIVYRAF